MATKKEKEEIRQSFERTLRNCYFYEKEEKTIALVNEIGVLRGIAYTMQTIGICPHPHNTDAFIYFINVQQELKGKE